MLGLVEQFEHAFDALNDAIPLGTFDAMASERPGLDHGGKLIGGDGDLPTREGFLPRLDLCLNLLGLDPRAALDALMRFHDLGQGLLNRCERDASRGGASRPSVQGGEGDLAAELVAERLADRIKRQAVIIAQACDKACQRGVWVFLTGLLASSRGWKAHLQIRAPLVQGHPQSHQVLLLRHA